MVGDRVIAEEILQDTMLAVWRGAGCFRGDSSVRSWVIAGGAPRTPRPAESPAATGRG